MKLGQMFDDALEAGVDMCVIPLQVWSGFRYEAQAPFEEGSYVLWICRRPSLLDGTVFRLGDGHREMSAQDVL